MSSDIVGTMNTYVVYCRIRFEFEPITVIAPNDALARLAAQEQCRILFGQLATYLYVKTVTPVSTAPSVPGDTKS